MTPHFLAGSSRPCSRVTKVLNPRPLARPANDDADGPMMAPVVAAALRHFARHGLAAAEVARVNAQRAASLGEWATCTHWLDICGAIDRRMGEDCRRAIAPGA